MLVVLSMLPAALYPVRHALALIGLLGLCVAYLQGGVAKLLDPAAAVAEAAALGVPFPTVSVAATVLTEFAAPALVLSGRLRWLGALWLAVFTAAATLLADRYWALPPGSAERFSGANAFYEHLGLIGGFLYVAAWDAGLFRSSVARSA